MTDSPIQCRDCTRHICLPPHVFHTGFPFSSQLLSLRALTLLHGSQAMLNAVASKETNKSRTDAPIGLAPQGAFSRARF
ncbi:hypothetical protein FA13DRAFT_1725199 [Coprinellus micaceus]|uniref:Uncharacterized protein n=1 Tax=Coprinellus micaceus TaxID=71717 RepID=A0A4Y7U054_COPMI|nr:hypothetical protein FA13DRAFT_1725199 [Coprinellus micaceus]